MSYLRVLLPHAGKLKQHILPVIRLEVGASVNGSAVRQANTVQGPTTVVGHQLYSDHIKLIDIGALLAVDFDRHKMFVHYRCNVCILETFPLHDMTPMAC